MNETLVTILGSGGIAMVAAALINAVMNKRKLSAEATSIITQAAGGIVQTLQDDNIRLRADNVRLSARWERTRMTILRRDEVFRLSLEEHSNWDTAMAKKLREAGINIPNPPNLVLPHVHLEYTDEESPISGSPGPLSA